MRRALPSFARSHVSEAYNRGFLGRLWGYFSFVFSSIYAGIWKARGPFDVILVTSPPLFVGITAYVLAALRSIPFVFEVRDLWPESAIDTGVLRNPTIIRLAYWFEGFIYRKSQRINVLTPAFHTKLVEKGVPENKLIFIPNAADFSISEEVLPQVDRAAFRAELGWTDKVVITYVGAHGVANHLIQVLETADLIKDRHPQVQFVLIGGGMEKEMLKRGLENVTFIDPVPKRELFRYLYASDFGTSVLKKVDTFKTVYSNKTFDYMACRRPVLMAIDGVSRELVEKAGCGVFVEPENPADFAAKIETYLHDSPERREREGEAGYQYARAHFDRDKLARQYLTHLQAVANAG